MAELPYATATSANDNNNNHSAEENNTCTHQNNCGTLANLPPPGGSHGSSLQVHQQAAPQHITSQGGATGAGDVPHHPVWHPHQARRLPDITEEGMDKQARVAVMPPEVEGGDPVIVEPHYLGQLFTP
jgi:hypothetical protein